MWSTSFTKELNKTASKVRWLEAGVGAVVGGATGYKADVKGKTFASTLGGAVAGAGAFPLASKLVRRASQKTLGKHVGKAYEAQAKTQVAAREGATKHITEMKVGKQETAYEIPIGKARRQVISKEVIPRLETMALSAEQKVDIGKIKDVASKRIQGSFMGVRGMFTTERAGRALKPLTMSAKQLKHGKGKYPLMKGGKAKPSEVLKSRKLVDFEDVMKNLGQRSPAGSVEQVQRTLKRVFDLAGG